MVLYIGKDKRKAIGFQKSSEYKNKSVINNDPQIRWYRPDYVTTVI